MIAGLDAAEEKLSSLGKGSFVPVSEVTQSLSYLRDRIGVPRDISIHGAQKMRAHLNWYIDSINKASHMFDT